VHLRYISKGLLILFAGGDPWKINETLQSGRPAQISDLAQAFHDAGKSTSDAETSFQQAKDRFAKSWTHENGDNPINDSAEVQRVTTRLGVQAAQLPKIAADLENVAATLAEAQRSGKSEISSLESQLQSIDDQIGEAVEVEKDPHLSEHDRHVLDDHITSLEQQAIDKTKDSLHKLEHIRDDYAGNLQRAEANLHTDGYDTTIVRGVDGHTPETPAGAEADVHKALAGDKDAATRVGAVLDSITDDQRAGKVPLTAEQASVLSQMQAQQHGMSIEDLKNAEERLGDQRHVVGDSWQLMSTPGISFPKTPLNPGDKEGSEKLQGGFAQLPQSVQDTLNAPGFMFADQTRTVANIVKDGNPALQRNTPLDQNLLHKGGQIMTQFSWSRNTYDETVEAVFSAAGRDHAAVNWLVNDLGICDGSTGTNFLENITHHAWSDGGGAAGSLFSWTQNASGPEAQIAGQTAQTYADYLGQHAKEFMDLPGHQTLGQLDPKLVRAFATGLSPYVSNIAGGSDDLSPFFHTPDADGNVANNTFPVAKGIFSVLSTDGEASDTFNGAAMRQIMADQNEYAQGVANHVPGAPTADAPLEHAATLKGLVDSGINNAVHAAGVNDDNRASEAYSRKESAYNSVVKGFGAAAKVGGNALPPPYNVLGKIGGPAVTMAGNTLEQDIIGAAPTPNAGPENLPGMPEAGAYQQVLDGLSANHVPIGGLPQGFVVPVDPGDPNGPQRIATFAEINSQGPRFTAFTYNQTLATALRGVLGDQATSTIEEHMRLQYDDVIKYPHPWE
jgi:hypothetical protein